MVEYPETSIVAHKGIFAACISLGRVWDDIHVKIVLIPLLDFIIREEPSPALNALRGQLWFFAVAKPTVVNDLRNHKPMIYLLNDSLEMSHIIPQDATKVKMAMTNILTSPLMC